MQRRVRAGEFEAVLDVLAARCVHAAGARAALGVLRAMARRAGSEVFLHQSEAVITRRDRRDTAATCRRSSAPRRVCPPCGPG